jgi:uncharacterized protein (DUF2126 family)
MPPHARMSLLQMLLLRALSRASGRRPTARAGHWGTRLHDEFMLPHFVAQDLRDVVEDLTGAGYTFRYEWFAPFLEFRFPRYGTVSYEASRSSCARRSSRGTCWASRWRRPGTSRYVDSSVERVQVKATRFNDSRYAITWQRALGAHDAFRATGRVRAGVRYRAWAPPSALHPTIGIHAPLVFDLVDLWNGALDRRLLVPRRAPEGAATTRRSR